ncbi:MAG: PD-(D/E)XK nuclease family protein [Anaerolineae bacterium]|jgi:CRISPR/Cas system-associated exonuclease Cas4 (RecB family)
MPLPSDFHFSQGSLQEYVDCPRRFQLCRVHRLRWPAVEAEPALENERRLQRGAAFHRLIHQHLVGIPAQPLSESVTDSDLRRWWRNYLESGPADLPSQHYPEIGLSAPVGAFRLVAQYDLVAVEPGERAVIVDWKTNHRRPSRQSLSDRLQSRVYPYLLVRAGASLNGGEKVRPEQVTMAYWFANFPEKPERFAYHSDQYDADRRYLEGLVAKIEESVEGCSEDEAFPRTDDQRRCRHCHYRSLCHRGVEAGPLDERSWEDREEEGFDFDLDFEQIVELDCG